MKSKPYIIVLAIILFSHTACKEEKKTLPKDIISKERMVEVITELELVQALSKLKFTSKETVKNRELLFQEIFNEFNITEEQFNNSLKYYAQTPIELSKLYDQAIGKIYKIQAEKEKEEREELD